MSKVLRSTATITAVFLSAVSAQAAMTVTFAPATAGNAASVTATVGYSGVTAISNGTQVVVCYDSAKLTYVSTTYANPPGETQPSQDQASGSLCTAPASRQVLLNYVSTSGTWPSNPTGSGTLAASGNLATIAFTTASPFTGSTTAVATENTALGGDYGLGTASGTLTAAAAGVNTWTAATPVNVGTTTAGGPAQNANAVLTASAGNTAAGSSASCAIGGADAALFTTTATGATVLAQTGTINLPVTFTPPTGTVAGAKTATLTCTAGAGTTLAGFPVTLNGTVTATPTGSLTLVPPTTSAGAPFNVGSVAAGGSVGTTAPVSAPAGNTGQAPIASCTAITSSIAGAFNYGAPPPTFPINIAPGSAANIPVFFAPPAGTAAGTVVTGNFTCTTGTGVTPTTFQVFVSGTVLSGVIPEPTGPAIAVPTMGALGLGLMSLLVAGFAGFAQRRRLGK